MSLVCGGLPEQRHRDIFIPGRASKWKHVYHWCSHCWNQTSSVVLPSLACSHATLCPCPSASHPRPIQALPALGRQQTPFTEPTIPAQQRSSVSQAKTAARSPRQPVTCGSCVSNQVSVVSCKSKPISVATGTGTFRYVSWGRTCAGPVGEPVLIQSEMPHTHALMHTITYPDG